MKLILISFITILCSGINSERAPHPFHVSISELEIKQDTLQIALRIFTDDLETALQEMSNEKVLLNDPSAPRRHSVLIKDYLFKTFTFGNGAKEFKIDWIGHEFEDDVCWIYGQVRVSSEQRILFIRNAILTEIYDNQQNIVHFKSEGEIETQLATNHHEDVRFSRP